MSEYCVITVVYVATLTGIYSFHHLGFRKVYFDLKAQILLPGKLALNLAFPWSLSPMMLAPYSGTYL